MERDDTLDSVAFSAPSQSGPGRTEDEGALVTLLSLKLLLLAFFILLNSHSALEELKARAVLESVNQAFDGRLYVETNDAPRGAADGPLEGTEFFLTDIGQIFAGMLPAVYREVTPRGGLMTLDLPASTVFARGETRLQAGRTKILDRLNERLRQSRGEQLDYRLTLLHAADSADGEARALMVERVARLAEYLVRRGQPATAITVGLYQAPKDIIRFEFRVRDLSFAGEQP